MRLLKKQVLLRLVNSYIVDSPQPANISYLWNFGSLLGTCLILQILTGVFLAMHYQPHVDFAFNSVEHIMRDVNNGWAVRYTHANVASFFFIFVYAHIFFSLFVYHNIYFISNLYYEYKLYTFFYLFDRHIFYSIFFNYYVIFSNSIIENFLNVIKCDPIKSSIKPSIVKDEAFLQWFVGFSDAESTFLINIKNNREIHFIFQITLHIDDVAVLYTIREKLGIGVVSIRSETCSLRVHSFQVIVKSLLPIFDKYPLLTHKQLDYKDWRKAVMFKKLGQENGRSIDKDIFSEIENIKNSINSNRTNYEGYNLTNDMINKNWLVGFVEGDGTFYFSHSSVVFGITKKDHPPKILEAIAQYLHHNIPLIPPYGNLIIPNKPNCIIKNNKNAFQLVITDKDVLFQYIYPFFRNLSFYSRKGIDFSIWSLVLYIVIHGYHNLAKGREILLKLANNMNSKRYFSDISDFIEVDEIKNLFRIDPPFDIHSGKSHFNLAKEYSLTKGSRKGFKVYIYKNEIEIKGSPFDSFRSGAKAIGLNSASSIRNYLDTGKIFKDGYTFYSSSQSKNE